MIHTDPTVQTGAAANTITLPVTTITRPQMLDLNLSSPGTSSLAVGLGSTTTVLDLSNPDVINSLVAPTSDPIIITPNTELRLITTITDAINSQGLLAATTPILTTMTTSTFPEGATIISENLLETSTSSLTMDTNTMDSTFSDETSSITDPSDIYMESLEDLDPAVAKAVRESASSGTLTPLIKTELKYTIQKKRILEGKLEMDPEELLAVKDTVEKVKICLYISISFEIFCILPSAISC